MKTVLFKEHEKLNAHI
ncbi:MAG: hypothetical protein ACYCSG_01400, partial [Thermoplasmataceae archaeon]